MTADAEPARLLPGCRLRRLYEGVKVAGVQISRELDDQDYGKREFAIKDPEGDLRALGPYRGEPVQQIPLRGCRVPEVAVDVNAPVLLWRL